jgi:hypothetical protein
MTGLRGRWPIWGTRFAIKRLVMFCGTQALQADIAIGLGRWQGRPRYLRIEQLRAGVPL